MGKWCGVATYFLYKKKEKLNIKVHNLMVSFHWLNKKYIFEKKIENYKALGPSYNLQKIHGLLS